MEHQSDFKELLELFNAQDVEYLIVGAYALAFHGAPRMTGDLDILVRPTQKNALKVLAALSQFGFGAVGLTEEDFLDPERVVQLGVPPVRVDLLTSLTGVTWEEAEREKAAGEYGAIPVCYLGRQQLIKNKRATGRLRDLADLEALGETE
jgi:hypothetical protein